MSSSSNGVSAPAGGVVSSSEKATSELPRRWEEEELGQGAYQRCLPEMLGLAKAKIMVVNLNLTELVATGLGVLPNVRMHRAALAKSVLDCRFHWVDSLEDYMLALNYARNPPRPAVYEDPRLRAADPFIANLKDMVERSRPRPVTPYYNLISDVLQSEFSAAVAGLRTPEEALQRAQKQVDHLTGVGE